MRVAIVAEYYPRAHDPALGIWAHRQAVATAAAGADVHVLVLHRPVPPRAALHARDGAALVAPLRQPLRAELDGMPGDLRPVPRAAAPAQLRHVGELGGAVARARPAAPAAPVPVRPRPRPLRRAGRRRRAARRRAARRSRSRSTAATCSPSPSRSRAGDARGARRPPPRRRRARELGRHGAARRGARGGEHARRPPRQRPAGRGRAGDARTARDRRQPDRAQAPRRRAARAVAAARRPPGRRVGGRRRRARARAARAARRASWTWPTASASPARCAPDRALEEARRGAVFVLPSVDEAFGVAYIEAMAGAVPAIGCRGEDGPEEIAAAGDGIRLVAPGDPEDLARELGELLASDDWRHELGAAARATVARRVHLGRVRARDGRGVRAGAARDERHGRAPGAATAARGSARCSPRCARRRSTAPVELLVIDSGSTRRLARARPPPRRPRGRDRRRPSSRTAARATG